MRSIGDEASKWWRLNSSKESSIMAASNEALQHFKKRIQSFFTVVGEICKILFVQKLAIFMEFFHVSFLGAQLRK